MKAGRRSHDTRRTRRGQRRSAAVRVAIGVLALAAAAAALNWIYHVARKPTELFFPVSGALSKTPADRVSEKTRLSVAP